MKSTFLVFLFSLWLLSATTSLATRPDPMYTLHMEQQGGADPDAIVQGMMAEGATAAASTQQGTTGQEGGANPSSTLQGMEKQQGGGFGTGSGFNIPGAGSGFNIPGMNGGYGSGFGGPNGGHSSNGIISNSMTCTEKGPCYNKKLTCPAKCFKSYSGGGKGYGYGGGSGGCTMDCKKCTAYC